MYKIFHFQRYLRGGVDFKKEARDPDHAHSNGIPVFTTTTIPASSALEILLGVPKF